MSDDAIIFTDAAASKVAELLREEGNPALMLRVYVQGGGCSGMQYGFEFDETVQDGDTLVERLGVKLLVDPMSYTLVAGVTVDFIDTLTHTGFRFDNPSASAQCSCGQSFSV